MLKGKIISRFRELLAQLQSQSTNATAPAPASGVENFQNIIKNAKLTKFHDDALVDKMSFATWITSHVKAVIGVTTDQHVQQLAHQYLSGSAISQSKATQRRPRPMRRRMNVSRHGWLRWKRLILSHTRWTV
jgi:hypothetical protein